jgi:type I restriction enzyme S subunit
VATNQGFANFVPAEGIDSDFLYYLLSFVAPVFIRLGAGTTFLEVNKRDLRKVRCSIPPPQERERIGRVLDAVDAAIERTRTAIEKARLVKRGLLQQFLESGLGRISAADRPGKFLANGWRLIRAGELLSGEPKNGISPPAEGRPPGYPTFSIAAVREGRIDLLNEAHRKYVRIRPDVAAECAVRRGDILIVRGNANPGLVGCCGVVDGYPDGCIYPDILKRVVFKNGNDGVLPEYAVMVWNHSVVHNQVLKRAKTSNGTLKINTRDVKSIIMPVAPTGEQQRIVDIIRAAEAREKALREILLLQMRLKRGLMHDLLTGKVRMTGEATSGWPPQSGAEALA